MTGPAVGITPDEVSRLAASLERAVTSAGTASQAIQRIRDRATAAEMSAGEPDAGAIIGLVGAVFGGGSEPDGGALRELAQQAPPVANEIRARLNHFLACERDNLPISPSLWFTDEPLPDPQKVKDAIAYFNAHIGDSGGFLWSDPAQGAQEVLGNWKQLSGSELDAVLNSLSPDQLKKLNGQLGDGSSWWGAGGADKGVQAGFSTLILSEAGPDTIAKLRPDLTNLQLNQDNAFKDKNLNWQPVNEPLFGPNGPDPNNDVNQGGANDCYFLSSLAAVARDDPGFIQSHIRQDPNRNYTVRLYQNGEPVDVTVTPDLPEGGQTYAHIDGGALWVALYEKAYAQLSSGYAVYGNGGVPASAMTTITGQQASQGDWNEGSGQSPSLSDIQSRLTQGHALVADSRGDNWDSHNEEVVGDHAYRIDSVYTDPQTHQQMVKLVNPWGRDGDANARQYIHLTEAEFQKDFGAVDDLPPGGW